MDDKETIDREPEEIKEDPPAETEDGGSPESPGESMRKPSPYSRKEPPKNQLAGSIETDSYDILPEIEPDPEVEAELAGKEGVEVAYSFQGDDIREGLKVFQRATIFKKNIIYTLILGAIFLIYMVNVAQNPKQMLSTVLAVLCIAVIAMIWYFPAQHIKKMAEGADSSSDLKFKMTIYDSCVRIAEENGSFVLHYIKEVTKTFETENLFLICVGKERIFILPKRYLGDGQEEPIRAMLSNGMKGGHFDRRAGK